MFSKRLVNWRKRRTNFYKTLFPNKKVTSLNIKYPSFFITISISTVAIKTTSRIPRQIFHPLKKALHAHALHLLVVVPPSLGQAFREARVFAGELGALKAKIYSFLNYPILYRTCEKARSSFRHETVFGGNVFTYLLNIQNIPFIALTTHYFLDI